LTAAPDLRADDPAARRAAAARRLRERLREGRRELGARFAAGEAGDGLEVARALAALTDAVVREALDVALALHPNPTPTEGERLSVAAVGGYGRGEMAPFSDVDLLFLTPWKATPWAESVIESALYLLWDLKLKVGYAVRTVDECLRLAREDMTIRTSLLEKRWLHGAREPIETLDRRLWRELFDRTGAEFVQAKLAERDARHARQGGSRYLLEPNVKESKGGLRDLQTLWWIAKYLYHADSVSALVRRGVFSAEEVETFSAAERFLWTVRLHLHWIAGRAVEQLSFDLQLEVADRTGYAGEGGQRGVERFMQSYFRAAKDVGDLTRWFCAALEHEHRRGRPGLVALARRLSFGAPKLSPGFALRDGRIDVAEDGLFRREPLAMLRLFDDGLRTGALVHPHAMRLLAANLDLVDDGFRADPQANALFLRLLCDSDDPERALRRMNESGLLGRFAPQFGRVVAMMQFNMYHHYTVDEHTILAVAELKRIERGALAEALPVATEIVRAGVDKRILAVALFLHDLGKGLLGDHSEIGETIARDLCPRFGLDPAQSATVAWLVRHHLLLSDVAQKRDVNDPATIRAFAMQVRSPERLRLLLVLTVCDIRAVGPGVWNNWKAQLIRTLYWETRDLLTGGFDRLSRAGRAEEAQGAFRQALAGWSEAEIETEIARHYPPYWLGLDASAHVAAAELARDHDDKTFSLAIDADESRDATRVLIHMSDHPGVFSRMAAALALARANIVDARTFTTHDGMAVSVFWVQSDEGRAYEPAQFDRLRRSVSRALAGEVRPRQALAERRRGAKRRERPFDWPTRITFDNEASELHTVIEVDTRDRVGLLHDLTGALASLNVNLVSAVVATYGEQAVDVFYVKDVFGLKLTSAAKRAAVERRLREAIARAAAETRPG
jgi:[protein-PII] uridylyltransferase